MINSQPMSVEQTVMNVKNKWGRRTTVWRGVSTVNSIVKNSHWRLTSGPVNYSCCCVYSTVLHWKSWRTALHCSLKYIAEQRSMFYLTGILVVTKYELCVHLKAIKIITKAGLSYPDVPVKEFRLNKVVLDEYV